MNRDERDAVAAPFGAAPEQVERDHLISHLLAALSARFTDRLHFIGGTALARTHLTDGRLSEDIDLVALGNRTKGGTHLPAFAASKTVTWQDRHASRDLWDLWAMAALGAIDDQAAALYTRYGPTNRPPARFLFDTVPDEADWTAQLAGQTTLNVTAEAAAAMVREAWARVTELDTMQEDGEL